MDLNDLDKKKLLTIIIVSYNSYNVINECLSEVIKTEFCPVVIVDNASPDGSAELLKKSFPSATVLALPENIGYGRGANVALRQIQTPYALLLNPDLIVTVEVIGRLIQYVVDDKENTAIWAPAVAKIDHAGGSPVNVEHVSGSAMLFNMQRLEKIGLFDENIFLYFEETDLCLRTLKAGFEIKLCGDVYFDHLQGKSSPSTPDIEYLKNWHFGWSKAYYYTKHGLFKRNDGAKCFLLTYLRKSLTLNQKKRKMYLSRAKGVKAFLKNDLKRI